MASRRTLTRRRRWVRRLAVALLAVLAAIPPATVVVMRGAGDMPTTASASFARSVSPAAGSTVPVSRALDRSWGSWSMGDVPDAAHLTRTAAANSRVAALMDGRDRGATPAGFDPDHATGDTGLAYAFSQCTWWAYLRRRQLGLPVGSHFGDGGRWADSAAALGYWVDRTPRVGDVMVFAPGQEGASKTYGHVAIVEKVNRDGSVVTSECGASYGGRPFSRTFANVHDFRYIHY